MRYIIVSITLCIFCFFGCSQNEGKTTADESTTSKSQEAALSTSTKPIASGTKGRTPSGYRYKFHISTNGVKPEIGDEVRYHEIVFKNDSLVQSTFYKFEPTLALIPSLDQIPNPPPPNFEGVMMMSPGDSITVWHDLDTVSAGNLPPWLKNSDVLRYELSMVSHRPKKDIEADILALKRREVTVGDSLRRRVSNFRAGKLKNELVTTDSGLQYIIHNEGKGKQVVDGNFVQVHYMGILQENGVSFNNTFVEARPFACQIGRGRVIKAWDEGLVNLKVGGSMTIFVPYKLGYGEAGRPGKEGAPAYIPERADLAFYVELVNVR